MGKTGGVKKANITKNTGKAGGKGKFAQMLQLAMTLSKGAGKGGSGKGKRGRVSSNKSRTPYSELPEERKEEIRTKHEERQTEEGREEAGNKVYVGTLVQRGRRHGWIKPSNVGKLPDEVQTKLKEMMKARKAN